MNRNFLYLFGVLLFSSATFASNSFYSDAQLEQERNSEDPEGKFLFNSGSNGYVVFNATYLLLCTGALLWGLAAALALYYLLGSSGESGYSGYSSGDSSSGGYSRGDYSRGFNWDGKHGSFNAYDSVNWEQFTILDFIAIAEEAYRKFNPADLECQKRLICEVHQNTSKFGFAARKMVDVFSYLQYIEVLNLPEEFKALAEEYLDAADRGRNMTKECGEVYNTCEFSVKQITDKFSHNEIK